jgi:hypothetical protein
MPATNVRIRSLLSWLAYEFGAARLMTAAARLEFVLGEFTATTMAKNCDRDVIGGPAADGAAKPDRSSSHKREFRPP